MNFKNKVNEFFEGIAGALYIISTFLFPIFSIVMVINSFDLPSWTSLIFTAILFLIPSFSSFAFSIAGLIGAIIGPQDLIAIIYYIIFGIIYIPRIIPIILCLFTKDE